MPASPSSPAPPSGVALPSSCKSRTPRDAANPAPPSLVALPPMPRMMRRCPASSAARRIAPTPYVVARSGSRTLESSSASPHACAVSTTAVWPSPREPHRATTGFTQRPRRLDGVVCAAGGLDQRVQGAVAAVSHRAPHDVGVGEHGEGRLHHGTGCPSSRQRALEGLRRDDNLHGDRVAK